MIETRDELERLVRQKFGHSVLPGFEESNEQYITKKVNVAWERMRIMKLDKECEYCFENRAHPDFVRTIYSTPYEEEPEEVHYCSVECGDNDYGITGFCENCCRDIRPVASDQMTCYFRMWHGNNLCLRCFEVELYDSGISRASIIEGRFPAIFEKMWDIHPLDNGYTELHSSYFYSGRDDRLTEELLKLFDSGHRILVGLDRMSICGGEGYISIYYRKVSDAQEEIC